MEDLHETLNATYAQKSTDALLQDREIMRGNPAYVLTIDSVLKEREAKRLSRDSESLEAAKLSAASASEQAEIAREQASSAREQARWAKWSAIIAVIAAIAANKDGIIGLIR